MANPFMEEIKVTIDDLPNRTAHERGYTDGRKNYNLRKYFHCNWGSILHAARYVLDFVVSSIREMDDE
jgi:hypothetical protein